MWKEFYRFTDGNEDPTKWFKGEEILSSFIYNGSSYGLANENHARGVYVWYGRYVWEES